MKHIHSLIALTRPFSPCRAEVLTIVIATQHLLPGFYDLHVKAHFSDTHSVEAYTGFGCKPTSSHL